MRKIMSTKDENSKNNYYVYRDNEGNFSDIITYRKNLIISIQNQKDIEENLEIKEFPLYGVTDERFERFAEISKDAGYTIYKVIEI